MTFHWDSHLNFIPPKAKGRLLGVMTVGVLPQAARVLELEEKGRQVVFEESSYDPFLAPYQIASSHSIRSLPVPLVFAYALQAGKDGFC